MGVHNNFRSTVRVSQAAECRCRSLGNHHTEYTEYRGWEFHRVAGCRNVKSVVRGKS